MIKKLRLKFVLVFLILVVSVFITSSCYAAENYTYGDFDITFDKESKTLTLVNNKYNTTHTFDISVGLDTYSNYYFTVSDHNSYPSSYSEYYNFGLVFANSFSWKRRTDISPGTYVYGNQNSYVYFIDYYVSTSGTTTCKSPYGSEVGFAESTSWYMRGARQLVLDLNYNYNYSNFSILTASHVITSPNGTVLYEPKADTSFEYSFNGIKRGQVELKIDGLDSSLNIYGYVGTENTYEIGDTFVSSTLSEYLRLIGMNSDNSDLSCSLYEGEKLLYYIVDEDNIILDIGYISELAEGYFLYGFPVSDGVDFVFLNNGQVYWNSDLTFKYQVNNANLLTKNEIVSAGNYSYIESDKTTAKIIYNGFVYDSNGEVLSFATTSTTNDLSSFYIKEVDTNYFEVHTLLKDLSYYWLQSIVLAGTDSSGNDIDFSNYSIRWSIPTWLTVDSIEIGTSTYDKYNGIITGFSSNGVLSIQLKICESLKNHTSDFNITLEIYDNNGDLVLTYLVNSDDIVKNQILSEENNLDKPSYDIIDNPNYTGGSNNYPGSDNIHNWSVDDFTNYLGTNNTMFNFFWAFLGNMPTWISTPLTILLIGLVVITLYKFIRG